MPREWSPDMVIYHHPCADGMGAALACYLSWPLAEFVPANYGAPPPDVAGMKVLIVDFSYKESVLRDMAARADSIIVLDHHKTAREDLYRYQVADFVGFNCRTAEVELMSVGDTEEPLRLIAEFDMNRSGAMMAWQFANPDREAPALIEAIQDRDLWRFAMPGSKAVAAYLRTVPKEMERWADLLLRPFGDIVKDGQLMLAYHDALVSEIADRAERDIWLGVPAMIVNCPAELASDVGNLLLERHHDVISVMWAQTSEHRSYSLRSADGRADVSELASKFGGGGHRNAAGYRVAV